MPRGRRIRRGMVPGRPRRSGQLTDLAHHRPGQHMVTATSRERRPGSVLEPGAAHAGVGPDPAVLQGRNQHLELVDLCRRVDRRGPDLVVAAPTAERGPWRPGPVRTSPVRLRQASPSPAPPPSSGTSSTGGTPSSTSARTTARHGTDRGHRAWTATPPPVPASSSPRCGRGEHGAVHPLARAPVATWSPPPARTKGLSWGPGRPSSVPNNSGAAHARPTGRCSSPTTRSPGTGPRALHSSSP